MREELMTDERDRTSKLFVSPTSVSPLVDILARLEKTTSAKPGSWVGRVLDAICCTNIGKYLRDTGRR